MKNTKPIYIVLGGSLILGVFFLIVFGILYNLSIVNALILLLTPITASLISFITFYFLIKIFITEKLTILHRSIRKDAMIVNSDSNFNLNDNIIEEAEFETKRWTEEKAQEISKLKEQEEFRREFLGNLGHELKTPVFSIQGYILTLLDGGLEDESVNRKFLERASKATERMTMILEDLDSITKMEVDKIDLEIKTFNILELVNDVFESLELKAKKKNISLRFAKEFDPVFVQADRNKINQVLYNLLNNSINYGNDNGETVIRFFIFDDVITVEITDNGVGIDQKELPRLFERFYRIEKSRNRHEGGSGLGLSIVKHIIESHQQIINVRSTVGIGSTFTFSLDKGGNETN